MNRMRNVLAAGLLLAAVLLVYMEGLVPASADGRVADRKAAAMNVRGPAAAGIFPALRDSSCGTLLKPGASWPPSVQAAWLYGCSDTPDLWPYVSVNAGVYRLGRSFVSFDTSSIPTSASVVSATLSLSPRLIMLTDPAGTTLEVVSSFHGQNLEASDYGRLGSTALASQSLSALLPDKVNSLPLGPGAFASINKGGITQLGLRLGMDLTNQAPQAPADATLGGAQVVINLDGLELTVIYEEASGPAPGPALTLVDPDLVGSNTLSQPAPPLLTLGGDDFSSGAVAYLSRAGLSYPLVGVQVRARTSLVGGLPMDLPVGMYDVVVANPDGGWAMLPGGFTVTTGAGPLIYRYNFPYLLSGALRENRNPGALP